MTHKIYEKADFNLGSHVNKFCSTYIDGLVMCVSQKHGLLVAGTEEGNLIVMSTDCWEQDPSRKATLRANHFMKIHKPLIMYKEILSMVNSIDISRRFVKRDGITIGQELLVLVTQNTNGICGESHCTLLEGCLLRMTLICLYEILSSLYID